jgi:hypothetical protein
MREVEVALDPQEARMGHVEVLWRAVEDLDSEICEVHHQAGMAMVEEEGEWRLLEVE